MKAPRWGKALVSGFALGLGLLAGGGLPAQSFTLESSTVAGGGGTSRGGPFALRGTIGQPDAGKTTLTGGTFALEGGFWVTVSTVVVPGGPTLVIEALENQVRLSWSPATPGFVLQYSESVAAPDWTPVPDASQNPVVLSLTAVSRFFRLVRE